jgi:hypothetical protein
MPITTGAFGSANNVTTTTALNFIPQVWSDEVIAAYKKKLVGVNEFRKLSFKGQKGNVIHVPSPVRGTAIAKSPNALIQIQQATESEVQIAINRHFHYARLIEDIVGVQALSSLRAFYTEDAGYALGRNVETDLFAQSAFLNAGTGTTAYNAAFIGGNGATAYTSGAPNSTDFTDIGIRRIIQRLDENDIPMDDRKMIISPGQRNVIMGINRFTEQAFVGEINGGNTIRSGQIGNIYGMPVFVSNNLPVATGGARINLIAHRDSLITVTQMDVRVQTQNKLEYLADLMVADTLYGVKAYQPGTTDVPTAGFTVATPS